jgi:glutamine cyclotransferase
MMRKWLFASAALLLAALARAATPEYGYQVVHVYPHDPKAFTQGLEYRGGFLYEGTGLEGRSSLRKVKLETGEVLQQVNLPGQYFGEGITVFNQQIFELTWKAQVGFVYDQNNLRNLRSFGYPGEGWGLANDGVQIYMSDGSAQIRIWDPASLREQKRLTVHDGARQIERLNELEWVSGEIYANVWQTDRIARISPADGRVTGWIDLAGILPAQDRAGVDVLNGIAYDSLGGRLFVTGKLWPKLFEIKLAPKAASKASAAKKAAATSPPQGSPGAGEAPLSGESKDCARPCAAALSSK